MDSWQWDYYENSTTLEWSTSFSKYEELIDDWLDLTVLEAGKRGQTLKNRLVGDEKMYKGLLNRELLSRKRSQVFQRYFRTHFIKRAHSVFPWRFDQFTRARRGNIEMIKWIGNLSLLLKRLKDGWMDISPTGSSDSRVSDVGCGQNTSSHAHFSQSMSVPPALTALFFTFTRTCVA